MTSRGKDKSKVEDSLAARFEAFSEGASKFSRGIEPHAEGQGMSEEAEANLRIARTVFGKWSLEILVLLYTMKRLGFEQMRKSLGGISPRVLSQKLKLLEGEGLVQRQVLSVAPTRVRYSLTQKGLTVARLGEPVFLFLRREGPREEKRTGSATLIG